MNSFSINYYEKKFLLAKINFSKRKEMNSFSINYYKKKFLLAKINFS